MKKFITIVLWSILCLFVPWQSLGAQTYYVNEGFENVADGSIPVGWVKGGTIVNATNNTHNWTVANNSSKAHEGSKYLYFNSYAIQSGLTGTITTAQISGITSETKLTFWLRNNDGGDFCVYISTDGGATYQANRLDSIPSSEKNTWEYKSYSLAGYANQTINVVFKVTSSYNGGVYLDEVNVYEPALCAQPVNLMLTSITTTSAVLQWNPSDEGAQTATYILNVYDGNGNYVCNNEVINEPYNFHTISGLTPGVKYYVTLKADCSADNKGISTISDVVTFTTQCESVSLPLTENFDNVQLGTVPGCWYASSSNVGVTTDVKRDTKSLKLKSTVTSSSKVVTRPIAHLGNDLEVDFWLYAPANTNLSVSLTNNPSDEAFSEPLYSFTTSESTNNSWTNYRFNTKNTASYATTQDVSVEFKLESGSETVVYIEDINIHAIPTCPRLEDLTYIASDTSTITFGWTETTTAPSNNYQIEYTTNGNTQYVMANSNPFTVTNLNPDTYYDFRVRSICAAGDTGEWSLDKYFRTRCGSQALPYTETFDHTRSLPTCFMTDVVYAPKGTEPASGWNIFYPTSISQNAYVHNGTGNSVYSPVSAEGTRYVLYLPPVNIPADQQYEVNFWMYRDYYYLNKKNEFVNVYVNTTPTLQGAVKLDSINRLVSEYPALETKTSGFYNYMYTIPFTGTVYIMFESVHQNTENLYLDDISVLPRTCHTNINTITSDFDITDNTFAANWHSLSDESQWIVNLTLTNLDQEKVVANLEKVVSTPDYTENISSYLNAGDRYSYSLLVRGYCDAAASLDSIVSKGNFTMPCNVVNLPIQENFATEVFPPRCWTIFTAKGNVSWERCTDKDFAVTPGSARFPYSNDAIGYLNSPKFTVEQGKEYQVIYSQYRYRHATSTTTIPDEGVTVWLSKTPNDTTNAVKLNYVSVYGLEDPVETASGTFKYECGFTAQDNGDYYIIFQSRQKGGKFNIVDDITIKKMPLCFTVDDDEINVTPRVDGVDIEFTDTIISRVEIVLADENTTHFDSVKPTDIRIIQTLAGTNRIVIVNNLPSDTRYNMFYRNLCDSAKGMISDWNTLPVAFKTKCTAFEVKAGTPFEDSFEEYTVDEELSSLISCFTITTNARKLYVKEGLGNGISDTGSVCIPYDGTKQLVTNYNGAGYLGRSLKLYAGKTYKTSVFSRVNVVFENFVADYVADVTFYYTPDGTTQKTKIGDTESAVSATWKNVSEFFTVPTDGIYEIGFDYTCNNKQSYMAFDKFTVTEVTCAPPFNVEVSAVTSASFTGVFTGAGSSYEVRLFTSMPDVNEATPAAAVVDTVSGNNFTVSGLTPNTHYYCIIRNLCSSDVSEWSEVVEFTTNCAPVSVPYSNTFENGNNDILCWRTFANSGNIEINSVVHHQGSKSLKISEGTTAITPEFDVTSLSGYTVTFWAYNATSEDVNFSLGVVTNVMDNASYEPVGDFTLESGTWKEFTQSLAILATEDYIDFADARFIAFVTADDYIFIDDVVFETTSTCPKVSALEVSNIGTDNVELSWEKAASESSWRVAAYTAKTSSLVKDTVVNATSVVMNNLLPATNYYFTVRAICGANDTSKVTTSVTIQTLCGQFELPYSNYFTDGEPVCWEIFREDQYAEDAHKWEWSSSKYYMTSLRTYSDQRSFLSTPEFKLKTANGVFVTVKGYTNSRVDSIESPLQYSVDGGTTYNTINADFFGCNFSAQEKTVFIPNVGPGNIKFRFVSDEHSQRCYTYLQGFAVEEQENCTKPQNVIISVNDTVISAEIEDSVAGHTQWQYVYGAGEFDPASKTPVLVSDSIFTVNGLEWSTTYTLYIRSYCSESEHSSWSAPYYFTTGCAAQALPYTEDFENLTSTEDIASQCYTYYTKCNSGNYCPEYEYESDYSDSKMFVMYPGNDYESFLQLPKINYPVNEIKVEYSYKNRTTYSYPQLKVGVMKPGVDTSFVELHSSPLVSKKTKAEVDFTKLPAADYTGYVVAFKLGNSTSRYYGTYIDDIRITPKVKCALDPVFKSFNYVSNDSLNFNVDFFADTLQVACVENGTPVENCSNIVSTVNTVVGVNNLISDTRYDIYLRNVCQGVAGNWVNVSSIYTACDTIIVTTQAPWVENFDNTTADYRFPHCIYAITENKVDGVTYPVVVDTTVVTAPASLAMKGTTEIVLPVFEKSLENYILTFYAKGSGKLYLGTVNGIDASSFSSLGTMYINSTAGHYSLDLSTKTIKGSRLAIMSSSDADLYIDSLAVSLPAACFTPKNLTVGEVLDIKATFSFMAPSLAQNVEYAVYTATDTAVHATVAAASTITVEGLTPATAYTFAVRSHCSDGDVSDWSTVNFATLNSSIVAPFTLDFEDDIFNSSIEFVNGANNNFVIGTCSTAVHSGTKALYISDDNGTTFNYNNRKKSVSYAILPIEFAKGDYAFDFDWKAGGESSFDFARVFLAPASMKFTSSTPSGLTDKKVPTGCIALDGGSKLNLSNNEWKHVTCSYSNSSETNVKMQLVFYWVNDGSSGKTPSVSFDNFIVSKNACNGGIDSVKVVGTGDTYASLMVYKSSELHDSITYVVKDAQNNTLFTNTINLSDGNPFTITGLESLTSYTVSINGYCDGGSTSAVATAFSTKCSPYVVNDTVSYFEGFESCTSETDFTTLFPCWDKQVNSGYGYFVSLPRYPNTIGSMPYEGSQGLRLYTGNDITISTNFQMVAGTYEFSLFAQQYTAGGTVKIMLRSFDSTTDSVLCTYTTTNEFAPVVAKLDIPEDGIYVVSINLNTTNGGKEYLAVDNFSLKKVRVVRPYDLKVENITSNSATVNWNSYSNTHKLIVKDNNSAVATVDTLLSAGEKTYSLTGLSDDTEYTVSLIAQEATGEVSDTAVCKFHTICAPVSRYEENFDDLDSLTRPNCWTFVSRKVTGESYEMSSSVAQWEVFTVKGHKALALNSSFALSNKSENMIYSPDIEVGSGMTLSFDYYNNVNYNETLKDSLVVSVVSNGVEHIILCKTAVDTQRNWQSFSYDMSEFQDSIVRIKFWTRSYQQNYETDNFVAIDNFLITCGVKGAEYTDVACAGESYVKYGFNIEAKDLVEGDTTTFTRRELSATGGCDTLITLKLFVPQQVSLVKYDTICAGDVYNDELFSHLLVTGKYTAVGTTVYGCDSTVTLYLTVLDLNTTTTVRLCEGETYSFAGQTLTEAGTYTDTITNDKGCQEISTLILSFTPKYTEINAVFCEGSSYTYEGQTYAEAGRFEVPFKNAQGCDSIIVLNLTMLESEVYDTLTICHGDAYPFGDQIITEAGEYSRTLVGASGCDSTIYLTVYTKPAPVGHFDDYVCQGETYSNYGFRNVVVTKDTVLTRSVSMAEGCDSIVEVAVSYILTDTVRIEATINDGETYNFGNTDYSVSGVYSHTFYAEETGCDSVVILTLTVVTGMESTSLLPVTVSPNPINGGQSTFVNHEWTAAEREGLKVEVLNSVGQIVDSFTPAVYPIEISGLYVRGVYYIRITSGTGDVYLGKLIVK